MRSDRGLYARCCGEVNAEANDGDAPPNKFDTYSHFPFPIDLIFTSSTFLEVSCCCWDFYLIVRSFTYSYISSDYYHYLTTTTVAVSTTTTTQLTVKYNRCNGVIFNECGRCTALNYNFSQCQCQCQCLLLTYSASEPKL